MKKLLNLSFMLAALALVSCSSIKSVRITRTQQANYKEFDDTEPIYKLSSTLQMLNEALETDVYNRNIWDATNDSTVVVFDKKGHLVSEISYSYTGYNQITNKWKNGLLVEKEERSYDKFINKTNVQNNKYEYYGKNLIKTITTYDNDSTNKNLTEYFRNKDGVLACEVRYDKNHGVSSVCVNTIDAGKIIKEEDVTVDGTFSCITKYKYADGKLIGKSDNSHWEEKDNSFKETLTSYYSYEYDGDNVVGIKSFLENYTSTYLNDKATVFEYEKFKHVFDEAMKKQENNAEESSNEIILEVEEEKNNSNIGFEYEKFKKAFEEELNKMNAEEVENVEEKKEEKKEEKPAKKLKDFCKTINQATLEYDEHNNIITMRYYDDWDEIDYVYNVAYEYDKHGNWTKMTITWNDKLMLVREREIKY